MVSTINLVSRSIRKAAVVGGTRIISSPNASSHDGGGFFGFIIEAAKSLLKPLAAFLSKILGWTFTQLWAGFCIAVGFIWNFNFNVTDTEIAASAESNFTTIAGLVGQGIGKTLGYLVCGALPSLAILAINPVVFDAIAPKITEELLEGLTQQYAAIITQSARLFLNSGFLLLYSSIRRAFRGNDEDLKNRLKAAGANQEKITKELEMRHQPFVISQKIQEGIDSIKGKKTHALVDQAYQEFGMACTEAGYVVAGALDNYIFQKNLAKNENLIEIEFDENNQPIVKEYQTTIDTKKQSIITEVLNVTPLK
ncbi:hypothetical protein [Nostoc sp.]|uniref:hypothetical protein n=1 Tax=Nostoc sp. TaxID=1180 RepID=UPI002FFA1955